MSHIPTCSCRITVFLSDTHTQRCGYVSVNIIINIVGHHEFSTSLNLQQSTILHKYWSCLITNWGIFWEFTYLSKNLEVFQNSDARMVAWGKFHYTGPINIRHHHTKFSCPGFMYPWVKHLVINIYFWCWH
jgi:hypothetical protein